MITTFPAERMFGWRKHAFVWLEKRIIATFSCFVLSDVVLLCMYCPHHAFVLVAKQPPLLRTRQHAQYSPIPMSYRGLQYKLDMFPEQATIGSLAASLARYSPVVDPHWLTTFFVHIAFERESRGYSGCVCPKLQCACLSAWPMRELIIVALTDLFTTERCHITKHQVV